jgi:hypothetical protein
VRAMTLLFCSNVACRIRTMCINDVCYILHRSPCRVQTCSFLDAPIIRTTSAGRPIAPRATRTESRRALKDRVSSTRPVVFFGLGYVRSTSRFAPAIRTRTIARIRSASAVRRPCVVRAARIRSSPSAVRGPVDSPPCILHRPAGIAGALQGVPVLVRAPHLGEALAKGRVTRQSGTRRMGFSGDFDVIPYPSPTFDTAGWTLPTIA